MMGPTIPCLALPPTSGIFEDDDQRASTGRIDPNPAHRRPAFVRPGALSIDTETILARLWRRGT